MNFSQDRFGDEVSIMSSNEDLAIDNGQIR